MGEAGANMRKLLQGAFNTLTGFFDRLVLQKNVGKMIGMICCPCCEVGT